jgi:hypothetical protein
MDISTAKTRRRALTKIWSVLLNDFCCVIDVNKYTSMLEQHGMASIKIQSFNTADTNCTSKQVKWGHRRTLVCITSLSIAEAVQLRLAG